MRYVSISHDAHVPASTARRRDQGGAFATRKPSQGPNRLCTTPAFAAMGKTTAGAVLHGLNVSDRRVECTPGWPEGRLNNKAACTV